MNYTSPLRHQQAVVTRLLWDKVKEDLTDLQDLANAIDELNNKWDELTNCLIRQRDERDIKISSLINELAEAKKNE